MTALSLGQVLARIRGLSRYVQGGTNEMHVFRKHLMERGETRPISSYMRYHLIYLAKAFFHPYRDKYPLFFVPIGIVCTIELHSDAFLGCF
jgi:hypothetical protein